MIWFTLQEDDGDGDAQFKEEELWLYSYYSLLLLGS